MPLSTSRSRCRRTASAARPPGRRQGHQPRWWRQRPMNFPSRRPDRAVHHRELAAAAAVVERACRLCVDVKRSLFSDGTNILEKNDQTPVTIADFGVQALVSLELQRLFPSIPLVAEEDSASLRRCSVDDDSCDILIDSIFRAVADKASNSDSPITQDDVLSAIDRGGKDAVSFDLNPATCWVLDPIDGTKGFLKGDDALYVVGLALVVNGELAVGVMGCPNWTNDTIENEEDISVTLLPRPVAMGFL